MIYAEPPHEPNEHLYIGVDWATGHDFTTATVATTVFVDGDYWGTTSLRLVNYDEWIELEEALCYQPPPWKRPLRMVAEPAPAQAHRRRPLTHRTGQRKTATAIRNFRRA